MEWLNELQAAISPITLLQLRQWARPKAPTDYIGTAGDPRACPVARAVTQLYNIPHPWDVRVVGKMGYHLDGKPAHTFWVVSIKQRCDIDPRYEFRIHDWNVVKFILTVDRANLHHTPASLLQNYNPDINEWRA